MSSTYDADRACQLHTNDVACSKCFAFRCVVQSADVDVTTSQQIEVSGSDLVTFEENVQPVVGDGSVMNAVVQDVKPNVGELADFMSRPVRIQSYTWNESDPTGWFAQFKPWTDYLNSAFIKKKLDNYAFIRGNLHLKVVVTASPFYYGLAMLSYNPLYGHNGAGAGQNGESDFDVGVIQRSQRPHIMILPQDSLGGELKLPFILNKSWADLLSISEIDSLGLCEIEVIAALQSANGVTGTGCSLQVFAWMTDVEVCQPSLGLALQSSDEYEETDGPISKIATSAARFANNFTGLPVIGKFAKATNIGGTAIASIARLFGFTDVNIIDAATPMRPLTVPQMSSASVGFNYDKIALDPKCELAVDGATVGLDLGDELSISSIAQREAILTTTQWNTSDAVDQQLFMTQVGPWAFRKTTFTDWYTFRYAPMAYLSELFFKHWRGDIIYRFDVIASKYHRGRLLVAYEAVGTNASNVVNTANPLGRVITHTLDLGVSRSLEIRVPYSQALPWLRTDGYTTNFANRGPDDNTNWNSDSASVNGHLVLRVLNSLTAPVASSNVQIVVSVRGAENLEFANPIDLPYNLTVLPPQSADVFEVEATSHVMGTPSQPSENRFVMNFGESIKSLRVLARRKTRNYLWYSDPDTATITRLDAFTRTRFPTPFGPQPNYGCDLMRTAHDDTNIMGNMTRNHVTNFIMPCFAGTRGSFNWTYIASNASAGGVNDVEMAIFRPVNGSNAIGSWGPTAYVSPLHASTNSSDAYGSQTYNWDTVANVHGTINKTATAGGQMAADTIGALQRFMPGGAGGSSIVQLARTGALAVTLPHYGARTFNFTSPSYITAPHTLDDGTIQKYTLAVLWNPNQGVSGRTFRIESWVGAGNDWSVMYFINTPRVYKCRVANGWGISAAVAPNS